MKSVKQHSTSPIIYLNRSDEIVGKTLITYDVGFTYRPDELSKIINGGFKLDFPDPIYGKQIYILNQGELRYEKRTGKDGYVSFDVYESVELVKPINVFDGRRWLPIYKIGIKALTNHLQLSEINQVLCLGVFLRNRKDNFNSDLADYSDLLLQLHKKETN